MSDSPQSYVALTGNPNCGKTTLFNALTGLRAKVGNYAGVTVERKEGALKGADGITILDLPGTYSLSPKSLDEEVSRDILFHRLDDVPAPSLVVVVVDASNLERNLYYATQVIELGYPTILGLNMTDVAEQNGHRVDVAALAKELGVPVLPLIASQGEGVGPLTKQIATSLSSSRREEAPSFNSELSQSLLTSAATGRLFVSLPAAFTTELTALAAALEKAFPKRWTSPQAEALLLLSDDKALASNTAHYPAELCAAVTAARQRLEAAGVDWRTATIEARYARIADIVAAAVTEEAVPHETLSDKLDRVFTHKFWGLAIFVGLMALMFQGIFSFAQIPMDWIKENLNDLGAWVAGTMPPGELNDLLVKGVIGGVGAVIVFLPQILLLFLFISLLEDTGYMARAAFLMDRLMSKVGLHGKSFIPMLSSYACAIPGIMATRTIETPKDRLVTILVAPLMSCSARLPVYAVLIAACVPDTKLAGVFGVQGLTMLAMYLLGTVMALAMAWLFKKTLLKGETPMLIMELPPYKRPVATTILRHMWDRSKLFLRRAGTVILGINIVLWFLATYPRSEQITQDFLTRRNLAIKATYPNTSFHIEDVMAGRMTFTDYFRFRATKLGDTNAPVLVEKLEALEKEEQGAKLRHSFAGRLGHLIEPAIAPLGFDWKMGIGIVASFAAREVFVSTMSVVYNVGEADDSDAGVASLAQVLQGEKRDDGQPAYTPLVGVTLMVFYVFALQCVSTIAVVRRETNSWKWPLFQLLYMTALAWVMAFLTYQGGKLLGWG
ncbi:MAG: ferrous iron transport protein B [Limisphaerales bacterium]|nr:MAG: ferrous iron transport protein B [Limisphaerales bacterium]KAG0506686.1 MAG: ferrous iron transport protein B [Limisphaerales bacterium]TXT50468.1 MAG: ferrous iron transport protein B [Limisphaerales bacterium]